MTHTFPIHKLPPADRASLAKSIRKAALENPGHFKHDLPTRSLPSLLWGRQQWSAFFQAAGWPEKDAEVMADGESPPEKPKRAYGVQSAILAVFRSGWRGTIDALAPRFPQWTRKQIQCGLIHLRDSREIVMGINEVWRRLD